MHLPNLPIILGRWSRLAEEKQAAEASAYPIRQSRSPQPCRHLLETGPASVVRTSCLQKITASRAILALTRVVPPLPGPLHKETRLFTSANLTWQRAVWLSYQLPSQTLTPSHPTNRPESRFLANACNYFVRQCRP